MVVSFAAVSASPAEAGSRGYRKSFHKPAYSLRGYGSGSSGVASWYGPGFHGRKTASGERFNANAMTAAHRTLPFGTRVQVVNQATGRSVVVRINDRGPFHGGRVIDLSRGSAAALGVTATGTARVRLVSLGD
jgi:rare lipoprotein A